MARAPAPALTDSERLAQLLLLSSLRPGQRRVASFIAGSAHSGGRTLTSAASEARSLGLASEPSARRVAQRLRGLRLIYCGSRAKRGTPLELTPLGKRILGGI